MTVSGSTRPRTIFDCNIFVQAVAFEDGPAAAAVRLAEMGRVDLFFSKAILAEVRRVIRYDEVRAISRNAMPARIDAILDHLTYRGTLLRRVRHLFDYPRDPDDEPYLDLAVAAKAEWLVTRDKDMLALATSHTPFARRFRQLTHGLRIGDPVQFLAELG
jgi:putative PIN family toxin of toxin-antitoxin system